MEFLSIGEKVKKLRKQLKMKQQDLQCDNITRAFISMIEIGKRVPSIDTAQYLINSFRNRAAELGITLDVDDLYLTRNAGEDAQIYCIKKLKTINSISDIKEIIDIGKEYNLAGVLADSYLSLGEVYFQNNNFMEAFINYTNALNFYRNIGSLYIESDLINKLGLCKLKQLQFDEALNYFNIANLHAATENIEDIKKRSFYNIAICNKKLNRVSDALTSLDICLSLLDKELDFSLYISVKILKANCYESQGLIDRSIEVLTNLIKDFKDPSHRLLGLIYNNLGSYYLQKCNFRKSLGYFNMSYKIRKNADKNMLGRTLIEKSFVYIKKNSYKQAITLLKRGILLVCKNNDLAYQLKGYYTLADIYTDLRIYDEAEKVYMTLLKLFKDNNVNNSKDEIIKINVKLSCLYLCQNNNIKLKEILLYLQDITTDNLIQHNI